MKVLKPSINDTNKKHTSLNCLASFITFQIVTRSRYSFIKYTKRTRGISIRVELFDEHSNL